jgi:hypothetical protein
MLIIDGAGRWKDFNVTFAVSDPIRLERVECNDKHHIVGIMIHIYVIYIMTFILATNTIYITFHAHAKQPMRLTYSKMPEKTATTT